MQRCALGIGYRQADYEEAARVWQAHGVLLHMAETGDKAIEMLKATDYVCVAVCSDEINYYPLISRLREVKSVPVLVLSPQYDAERRQSFIQSGALQYLTQTNHVSDAASSGKSAIQYYLGLRGPKDPVTILQLGELMLYVEYRKVEVQGQEIELTPTEFDILLLLTTNMQHVYTFEMIFEQVRGEPYRYSSKKTINNHITNLRQKLKVTADSPEYIKNVHGVGYKFDLG